MKQVAKKEDCSGNDLVLNNKARNFVAKLLTKPTRPNGALVKAMRRATKLLTAKEKGAAC